jgi:4-cresol dehydrogenase (hydroxylating)
MADHASSASPSNLRLPLQYNVSTENLAKAFARLTESLGQGAVLAEEPRVLEFHDPYEDEGAVNFLPSFVVQPSSVEEVQTVLRIANELRIPVWTSSVGRNLGYGGAAPIVNGSIVLSLRRMKKVLEINEEAGYALIEPGVRFFDLYEEIKSRKANFWMSVPDLGCGSVIGNALEHGVGATVYADHASAVCGMELVLANGDLVRTGFGAATGSEMWQRHKRGFGPSLDSLFMQSNFGIVTKLGIWLMPQPEVFVTGSISSDAEEDIVAIIDTLRPLVLNGTIQGMPLIASAPLPEDGVRRNPWDDTTGLSGLSKLSALQFPGRWCARISFYGHESVVAAQRVIVEDEVAKISTAKLELRSYPGTVVAEDVLPQDLCAGGIPNMEMLDLLRAHFGETVGHVDFSVVIPFNGQSAAKHEAMTQSILREAGLVGTFAWLATPRSLTGTCMVLFDINDREQSERAYATVESLGTKMAERGWYEDRAHPSLIPYVTSKFEFNDHSLYRTYGKIKDALDPAGILSPGNHGIWPSSGPEEREAEKTELLGRSGVSNNS